MRAEEITINVKIDGDMVEQIRQLVREEIAAHTERLNSEQVDGGLLAKVVIDNLNSGIRKAHRDI